MEFAKDSSIEVLGELMEEKGVSVSVVDAFAENFIDGPTFLMLTEEDLKSLIPLIGDRARVRMLISQAKVSEKLGGAGFAGQPTELYVWLAEFFAH